MNAGEAGLTRRRLLQSTAVLGAAAVTGTLLPADFAEAAETSFKAESGSPVFFRGWEFRTDAVQGNVELYNKEFGGKVDYATVTGDYPQTMERGLIAKADLDVLYANPSSAVRYYEGGWVMPASDLPNGKEIADAMYPNIREAWSHKGKLLGLSYFVSTRGVMVVNLAKRRLPASLRPTTHKNWPELYDMLYKQGASRARSSPIFRTGSARGLAPAGALCGR